MFPRPSALGGWGSGGGLIARSRPARPRRGRRLLVLVGGVVTALVVAACSGHTTGASSVTANTATLNFVGSCGSGENCSWYVQYRQVGTST